MNNNKQPTANNLQNRARHYAMIIQLLFAREGITGRMEMATRGARHLSLAIKLSDPVKLKPALELAEPMALSCNVRSVLAQRISGVISYQLELPAGFWEFYTRADLPNSEAIGLAEQRRPVDFELDPAHALIAGTSGAGKSETLKSILVALLTSFSPDDLGLILIDPHNDYQDFANEAHLVLPIATEPNEIQNALTYAHKELVQRKENNLKDGKTLVVAIDEADSVLTGANLAIAKTISKQARKYRINLIVATQKPLHADLPGILDNLMNKFIGQLSDAATSARVTGHAGLMAHKLTPKGDFLHITGPDVTRCQIAMTTPADYARLERSEVKPVNAGPLAVLDLPGELPVRQPGRPNLVLNPEYLAWYFHHNPEKISRAMAQKMLGLSRDSHELHRDFARRFVAAYLKLRSGRMLQ